MAEKPCKMSQISMMNLSLENHLEQTEGKEKSMTEKLDLITDDTDDTDDTDEHSEGRCKPRNENSDSISKEEPMTSMTSVEEGTKPTGNRKGKVQKRKMEKGGKGKKGKEWQKLHYIIYSSVSIVCALSVMIIWLKNRNNSIIEDPEKAKNETASPSNSCQFWEITGDGYCDKEANIPECGYDFQDCCQQENDRSLCPNCTCHLTEDEVQLFKNQSCIERSHIDPQPLYFEALFPELSHNAGGPGSHHLGNGVCDLNINKDKYFFDIGDCCLSSINEEMKCRLGAIVIECPPHTCIRSNNFCIAEELGDGLCQDHNNGPYCDFDLGDCCTSKNNHLNESDSKDCCACFCHNAEINFFG